MPWQPLFVHQIGASSNISSSNNCSDGIQWIYKVLNDCVCDGRGIASVFLGLASILIWMLVSVPLVSYLVFTFLFNKVFHQYVDSDFKKKQIKA